MVLQGDEQAHLLSLLLPSSGGYDSPSGLSAERRSDTPQTPLAGASCAAAVVAGKGGSVAVAAGAAAGAQWQVVRVGNRGVGPTVAGAAGTAGAAGGPEPWANKSDAGPQAAMLPAGAAPAAAAEQGTDAAATVAQPWEVTPPVAVRPSAAMAATAGGAGLGTQGAWEAMPAFDTKDVAMRDADEEDLLDWDGNSCPWLTDNDDGLLMGNGSQML